MNLHALRPAGGTSVEELSQLVNAQGWQATLPERLSDQLLLRLARDARAVECDSIDLRGRQKAMASVLYAMVSLMAGESAQVGTKQGLKLTEEEMMSSLWIYRGGLDTEICTRILGLPSKAMIGFLDVLRAQVAGWR